jgi:uncharacterized protein (DUF2336 family)
LKEGGMTQLDRKSGDAAPDALDSRTALKILETRTREAQDVLARRADAGPDVLHYLAAHGAPATRAAIAANPAASPVTNRLLADDDEADVRAELAVKIARLLPGLSRDEGNQLFAMTIETLEALARDASVTVRAILAEEIKSLNCVPHEIVRKLAQDAQSMVAVPILEYSPLLSDTDLMEIIACAQANEVLAAVARRRNVSEEVSAAIVKSLDIPAVAALLVNPNAAIRKDTLERILAEAEEVSDWHMPLALRADLSARAIRRIAGFVGAAIIERLAARHDLSEETRLHLSRELRARLAETEIEMGAPAQPGKLAELVAAAKQAGKLDGTFLEQAAQSGNRELTVLALAELAGVPVTTVKRILSARNAKPVVALVWHAHLSMRVAFRIQTAIMKLPAHDLLPARGGTNFPLSKEEMRWHLAYFDIHV